MRRSIYLPDAKSEEVKAKLEDGVLKITIQKDTEAKDKYKIDIED